MVWRCCSHAHPTHRAAADGRACSAAEVPHPTQDLRGNSCSTGLGVERAGGRLPRETLSPRPCGALFVGDWRRGGSRCLDDVPRELRMRVPFRDHAPTLRDCSGADGKSGAGRDTHASPVGGIATPSARLSTPETREQERRSTIQVDVARGGCVCIPPTPAIALPPTREPPPPPKCRIQLRTCGGIPAERGLVSNALAR